MRIARVLQSSSLIELNDAEQLGVTEQGKKQPQQDHEKQLAKHSRNCFKAESLAVVRLFYENTAKRACSSSGFRRRITASRRHPALNMMRGMLICFARSWTLGRITTELGLQLQQIGENVGLAPQLVGDHRRLARNRRDHGHPDSTALHCFDQRAKVSVTREEYDVIEVGGKFHRIDCKLDVHVAFDLPVAVGVDKFLGGFGDHGKAVVIKPIEQRTN
jgi:hypothetical protein